jgi:hypothetical protein
VYDQRTGQENPHMSNAVYRLHEWLADRIPGMQYPKPIVITRVPPPPLFKNQMPLWKRYLLVLFACIAIPLGLVLLFFAGLALWAIFSA